MDDYDQGNGLSAFAAYEIGRAHGSSGNGTAQVLASVRNRLRGPRYDVRDLLHELQQAHERERAWAHEAQYWRSNYDTLSAWADEVLVELNAYRAERGKNGQD